MYPADPILLIRRPNRRLRRATAAGRAERELYLKKSHLTRYLDWAMLTFSLFPAEIEAWQKEYLHPLFRVIG